MLYTIIFLKNLLEFSKHTTDKKGKHFMLALGRRSIFYKKMVAFLTNVLNNRLRYKNAL
jgi:hypothetical protein